jgi:predicted transcriptional regulator
MMIAQAVHAQLLPITLQKMRDVIPKDRRLGVRAVAEEVNLDRESVRRILRKELNMRKFVQKCFQNCCQLSQLRRELF